MKKKYHILNGDSLKVQFPKQITGEIIIARECFVDGDVRGATLDELFKIRAKFITEFYGDHSIEDYYTNSVSEFERIQKIPDKSEINLWFEDDLFCQVNFWFTVYLILNSTQECNVFLVRPDIHTQFGFGGLNELELVTVFKQKTQITELVEISNLWSSYQKNDTNELIKVAKELGTKYPFIYKAVEAHLDRIPSENNPGRPVQSLLDIMNELETESFRTIFIEFNKRESIYGFGDLQVKRLYEEIINNRQQFI